MCDEYEMLVDIYDFTCPLFTKRKKMVKVYSEKDVLDHEVRDV